MELLFQRQRHAAPIPPDEFQRWIEPLLHLAGGYAYSIVRNREDAEDAVQEAALKAFKAVGRFDRSKSFKGWWFAILRNCCLDLLQKDVHKPPTAGSTPMSLSPITITVRNGWRAVRNFYGP